MLPTFRVFTIPGFRLALAAASIAVWLPVCGLLLRASQTAAPPTAAPKTVPVAAPFLPGNSTEGVAQIEKLLDSLVRFDQNGRVPGQKIGFELPERVINEYLAYALLRKSRPGINKASVTLVGASEVAAVAEIDFDAVRGWNADLVPEPFRPALAGRRAVRFNARLESQNGSLSFTVKSAQGPDGTTIPTTVMAAIVEAIGLHQPEALEMAKPIPLPFGLKRVWINRSAFCGET